MATSVFFNGQKIVIPGSYSKTDAESLDTPALGATGTVAVLGTAEGGLPMSAVTNAEDVPRFRDAQRARNAYRSGQLLEVAAMLFKPANDPDVPSGALEFVACKVNPATQSVGALQNADGDVIDLTSVDYGAFTEQVNVDVQDGSNQGKLLTIAFEDQTETGDDIGGDAVASLLYTPGTNGYSTALLTVSTAGVLSVAATKASVGLDGDPSAANVAGAVSVVSANAADTTQVVEVYGLVGSVPTIERINLNGTTPVSGTAVFAAGSILGARVVGTTLGAVTIDDSAATEIFVVPLGADQTQGLVVCEDCYVSGTALSIVSSGASTNDLYVFGRDAAGATLAEVVTLTGTTPVVTTASTFAHIDALVLGDIEAAQTVTVSVVAAATTIAVQSTLAQVRDFFNARASASAGFAFTVLTGETSLSPANLDAVTTGVNVRSATASLLADLYAVTKWINENSAYVTAVRSSGATGAPSNTAAPVFLSGGIEGTATFSDYQAALNRLKELQINTIVDLSGDPAVAAALNAHCAYMGGIGRSERDGVVGCLGAGGDVPTKAEAKAFAVALNSRHIRVCAQAITRYNSAGERTRFLPPYAAAIVAGAQAGSLVGTSLTRKQMNILGVDQSSTWNPVVDGAEMIESGILVFEPVQNLGIRVLRNVTTHLSSDNIAFVEASVNEAANFATNNFRTAMDFIVGATGFSGTEAAVRSAAIAVLGLLVDNGIIFGHQNLSVSLSLDRCLVGVDMAINSPINFVTSTIHLITPAQLTSAVTA